jgi:hypothetical protein
MQVRLAVDDPSGKASREERPEAAISVVERLSVGSEKPLESARKLSPCRLEDEVEVRRHQTQRVDRPTVAFRAAPRACEELMTVVIAAEDRAAVHAA